MLFTTPQPIPPAAAVALVRAVQAVDALADVSIDSTGRQVRIRGGLTVQQAAAALGSAGVAGVVTDTEHVSGGSTCCGGCA
jgi:hypothetical protein